MVKRELDTAKRARPDRISESEQRKKKKKKIRSPANYRHKSYESGYTVDIADLLFTPERDFLLKSNGQKVRIDDLKGKSIVLIILPMSEHWVNPGDNLDLIQAYNEVSPMGNVEFVFVPVYLDHGLYTNHHFASEEDVFDHLFSTFPFPAVPYSEADLASSGDRVVNTFSVDEERLALNSFPYWVIIDPSSRVVLTRDMYHDLFKHFGGAELYPFSAERIKTLNLEYLSGHSTRVRKRLISSWDQLLASPTRDFLLSGNCDRVPISSLKGKVIGLYFCENIPCPPRMEVIKRVYREAKLLGYDFEIVQINFHYHCFNATVNVHNLSVQECCQYENINWLTLPFKDPSCRKLQRILSCTEMYYDFWEGDCLVIIDTRQNDVENGVFFEFCGAEFCEEFGIEGYPFTRQGLVKRKCRIQKKEVQLQKLFPPGQCHLIRPAGHDGGHGFSDSPLFGKRVVVLFGEEYECKSNFFLTMLKYKYRRQEDKDDMFEVVYVSTDCCESSFTECVKDMPWLVHPYAHDFQKWCSSKIFSDKGVGLRAAAFDKKGKLIAKQCLFDTGHNLFRLPYLSECLDTRFPFVSRDLQGSMFKQLFSQGIKMDAYYNSDIDSDSDGDDH